MNAGATVALVTCLIALVALVLLGGDSWRAIVGVGVLSVVTLVLTLAPPTLPSKRTKDE